MVCLWVRMCSMVSSGSVVLILCLMRLMVVVVFMVGCL